MNIDQYLVNDLVVMEDVCNSNCSYCITASSRFKPKHDLTICEEKLEFHLDKMLDEENSYGPGKQLKERLDKVTEILLQATSPLILKISGGEIFLIKGILDYIEQQTENYKRVQILTNGTLLNKKILERIAKVENICLQISMDGHTQELNGYRVKSKIVQDKLCRILDLCKQLNIKLEINCVLTKRNIEGIYDFACFLKQYDNLLFLPYPIRGDFREDFIPDSSQLDGLKKLLEEYEELKYILPPERYLIELLVFLETGERQTKCYIPTVIYQSFDDGIITPCPNIWFKSFGNILQDSKEVISKLQSSPFYNLLDRDKLVLEKCQKCYTPWDIINLFLNGKINLKELAKIHLYNHHSILDFFSDKYKEINNTEIL